jgi:pimeloyl-ACP methyl ester carboxylesterase
VFLAREIIPRSNVAGSGPARVGQYHGLSPCGAYDMAGNVKEWCWNSAGDGKRYLMGGAWDEKDYMFTTQDARAPMDREPNIGFRCVKDLPKEPPPPDAFDENKPQRRDFLAEKVLSDGEFQLVKGQFAYDRSKPLNASVQHLEETASWVHERVEIDAAYENERLAVHLFLSKEGPAPQQPVIFWPGAGAWYARNISSPSDENLSFLIRSGRAVVWPIYKGTFERRFQPPDLAESRLEVTVQQVADLGRSIDYLQSRGDLDARAIGYYGASWGGSHMVRALAVEDRIKAAVLIEGGLPGGGFERPDRADNRAARDPIHYLPRVTIPVLMLNGRFDSVFPPAESQEPMFRLLGTDPARKRHVLSASGHVSGLTSERMDECLRWFDQYLGPAGRRDAAVATRPHRSGDAPARGALREKN